jgi:hypothetical protein
VVVVCCSRVDKRMVLYVPSLSVLSFDLSKDVAVDLSVDVDDRCSNQLMLMYQLIAISN